MSSTERIHIGRDNEVTVRFRLPGKPTPLQGVTRITVKLVEADITVDSDTNHTYITWTADGAVTLKFGGVAATGKQNTIVTAYDPLHPNGQVIAEPGGKNNRLTLEFVGG